MRPSPRVMRLLLLPEMEASRKRKTSPMDVRRSKGSSLEIVLRLILIGLMRAATPMRSKMLIMLLPRTLPRSISVLPESIEEIETANSGAPVPKATMVRPITCLDTLKLDATLLAPSTSQSAPLIRMAKPKSNNSI